ncbi:MAG: hypothetical protein AAFX05_04390 [Planctomycetota bacterium]
MVDEQRKSIARSVGEFFGHIWKGVTTDVSAERQVLRTEVEEEQHEAQGKKVTLRRTTIEEIETEQ